MSIYVLDATIAAFLLASFIHDRFAWLNQKADELENVLFDGWLHYNQYGDPASWIQHGITSAVVAFLVGALSDLLGIGFRVGFLHGAVIMAGFYLIREGHQAYTQWREDGPRGPFVDRRTHPWWRRGYHAGFLVDGLMDLAGPITIAVGAWLAGG